jgi:zinc transport system ATP-binding protein
MELIKINKLTFRYESRDDEDTLKNISLSVNEGDFLCIVGENGSGKSTLIKCLVGLNKVPDGKIIINEKLGYLPQKTEIQANFPASIEEVVMSGTISNNIKKIWYTKEDKQKATEIMKELDIYNMRKKCFRDLSGGQQQRVLIARAMCATNKIIVLDEPTNGLDPNIARKIYETLKKLNTKSKLTIVMVSHDIERAIKYATRIVEIEKGKVKYNDLASKYKIS